MNAWYVIRTKLKKEKEVINQLNRAHYELFFPQMNAVPSPKPLFPCYLFIRTDFTDPNHHRMVRYTRGVNRILGTGTDPAPVSDIVIETLKMKTENGLLREQELLFKEGDEVKVKKGILKDLQGMIEKNLPAAGRVKVLFKWLNVNMRATLKYTDLERHG